MNRGARRADIFPTADARDMFLQLLAELPPRFGLRVHGYALMPNHYHLMLESTTGNLSRAMQFLARDYTRYVNVQMKWDGALFRGRFRNRVVDTDAYWRHLLAYLHLNPERAGLSKLDDPLWTSHQAYTADERCPDWLTTTELQALFGLQSSYVAYMEDAIGDKSDAPPDFKPGELWRRKSTGAAEGLITFEPYAAVADALARACEVTGVEFDELTTLKRGRPPNKPAWVAMWWMCRRCAIPPSTVARAFGTRTPTISRIVRRVEDARAGDEVLGEWIRQLCARESGPTTPPRKRRRKPKELSATHPHSPTAAEIELMREMR
ncbi:MAG: transposase [Myxococcales bacterium]|nr:transposase [Myxococcales bacterium]